MKKVKTRDERKAIAQRSKARQASRKPRARPRKDWSDYDEEAPFEDFERIAPTQRGAPLSAKPPADATLEHPWLVVSVHAGRVEIHRKDRTRSAHLGGRPLPQGPPVVGDRVAIQELPQGECRVRSIAERRSQLARQDPGHAYREKRLAANVDVALITLAPKSDGHLRFGLIERMRIALEAGGITPIVVVTKLDRLDAAGRAALQQDLAELQDAGLETFATSALEGAGIAELQTRIHGCIAVAAGHSGVGKSTLLNALDPGGSRDTGGVRARDDRGRHTTTASRMTRFGEGWLIDTPGIRSFGLGEKSPEQWLEHFPLLMELAQECPKGCAHEQSDCALQLGARESPEVRRAWLSYRRLVRDHGDA